MRVRARCFLALPDFGQHKNSARKKDANNIISPHNPVVNNYFLKFVNKLLILYAPELKHFGCHMKSGRPFRGTAGPLGMISQRIGLKNDQRNYLIVTVAPTSSSLALICSASSLATASLITFGAPSTASLASFRPRPVISRTTLITLIF